MSVTAVGHAFTPNELWTLGIAAYAAVVSTFVLGWDAYKWLASGARVELSVSANMIFVGTALDNPDKSHFSVTAYNVGDRPTTITNLGGMYFDTWWSAYVRRKRPKRAFVVSMPSTAQRIPYRFEVGDQSIGLTEQTEELEQWAKNGYLFLILYTADGGRGHRARVVIREKKVSKNK